MTPPDTSAPAVEAMIARLRDPYIGKCCDHADEAADMLAALIARAERAERAVDALDRITTNNTQRFIEDITALRAELATVKGERYAAREALMKAQQILSWLRISPPWMLKVAEKHCDWNQFRHALNAAFNAADERARKKPTT